MSSAAASAFGSGALTVFGAGLGGMVGAAFGAAVGYNKGRIEQENATVFGCIIGAAAVGGIIAAIAGASSYRSGKQDALATPPQIPPTGQ